MWVLLLVVAQVVVRVVCDTPMSPQSQMLLLVLSVVAALGSWVVSNRMHLPSVFLAEFLSFFEAADDMHCICKAGILHGHC